MAVAIEHVAAVVIGRNEGELLKVSLASVQAAGIPVIYADSGSSDGSPAVARELGATAIELDPSRPFSAARGRNEGLDEVQRRWPQIKYVVFLDGDCVLEPGFPAAAAATFERNADCAIVTGHLTERHPDASIYNRLCAIEWRSPAGRIGNARLGGIMAARISAFRDVGGFKEQLIAGEEPDLAARLGRAGYIIFKIDVPMAVHDAEMLSFGQWWKRAMRGGQGVAQLFELHRRTTSRLGAREVRSASFWGFALPLMTLALVWPTRGLSLVMLSGYVLLGWRVFKHYCGTGLARSEAWLVTRFILYSKFAEFFGILRYCFNRLFGRSHIIG
jgi:glycosyltransferase involved in cell wall biosynthesis